MRECFAKWTINYAISRLLALMRNKMCLTVEESSMFFKLNTAPSYSPSQSLLISCHLSTAHCGLNAKIPKQKLKGYLVYRSNRHRWRLTSPFNNHCQNSIEAWVVIAGCLWECEMNPRAPCSKIQECILIWEDFCVKTWFIGITQTAELSGSQTPSVKPVLEKMKKVQAPRLQQKGILFLSIINNMDNKIKQKIQDSKMLAPEKVFLLMAPHESHS